MAWEFSLFSFLMKSATVRPKPLRRWISLLMHWKIWNPWKRGEEEDSAAKLKIMVVDDNPVNLQVIKNQLLRLYLPGDAFSFRRGGLEAF